MSELALYRKYRSANFDEVVGQDHIVSTLKQAITSGRTSHAYLFTGPRGVGKTSVARIMARSLNCTGETKPCGKCTNCLAALAGNLDIIEIDAASNRGIDEIRDLREKINLAPSLGSFKIYIIDEVHMLTEPAFNALLKTLEEPPAHVVFVLATTEAHKLPATIISRTQRFNFHPIDNAVVARHLKDIASRESISVDETGLALLAEAAGGSFRDGLSLLDQVAALGSGITQDDVRGLLGWGSAEQIAGLVSAILSHDTAGALDIVDSLHESGAQPIPLINQLIKVTRSELHQAIRARGDASAIARLLDSLIAASRSPLPQYALEIAIARFQESNNVVHGPQSAGRQSVVSEKAPKVERAAIVAQVSKAASETRTPTQEANSDEKLLDTQPVKTVAPAEKPTENHEAEPQAYWVKTLSEIKARNNSLYALLCSCSAQLHPDRIELIARFNFHRERLLEPKNLQLIEAAAARAHGRAMPVIIAELQVVAVGQQSEDSSAELMTSALEILGGEVVE